MNAHVFIKGDEENRQWTPMSRRKPQPLPTIKLTPRTPNHLSIKSLRTSAQRKAKQGEYSSAIALLSQAIKHHPTHAIDYNNRGLIYFQMGQRQKALDDYNRALQLNPELDSAYNNRGNYYAATGQLAKALADYEKALDLNPRNVRTWINQAITFRELGLYDLAIENLDLALILGCLQNHIYAERGRTYHLRGDWNCVIADYQRALCELPVSGTSGRLRRKVETWMGELLDPLSA